MARGHRTKETASVSLLLFALAASGCGTSRRLAVDAAPDVAPDAATDVFAKPDAAIDRSAIDSSPDGVADLAADAVEVDAPPADVAVDTADDVTEPCVEPTHSDDCSQVGFFQCGFSAHCEGSVVTASWHEHFFCGNTEDILEFTCSYTCPNNCTDAGGWPGTGTQLVNDYCTP